MTQEAGKVHLAWGAAPLCAQRFPKPTLTKDPRAVTCQSCVNASMVALRTTHRDTHPLLDFAPTHADAVAMVAAAGMR